MQSHHHRSRLLTFLVGMVLTLSLWGPLWVGAQGVVPDFYKDPGLYPNRDYLSQSVTEHIDPFTGSLQIHAVDLRVPGNGGLDINVVRSYNSAGVDSSNPATYFGTAGVGWTLHFGRVLRVGTNICNYLGATIANDAVLELPDGSRQILAVTGSVSPMLLTTQFWRADCASSGLGLTVYSPSGLRYDMTQQVRASSGTNNTFAWYATRITDRNGNTLNISYVNPAGPEIRNVTSSDNRTVLFNYADVGQASSRITSISSGSTTWLYNYSRIDGYLNTYQLSSVTRPDRLSWIYAYNGNLGTSAAGSFMMRAMAYPQGGMVNYGYDWVYFDSQANPMSRSDVVARKSTSGGGSWSFRYQPGSPGQYDTTIVGSPGGVLTYRHIGPNFSSSGKVWMVGLLMSKTVGNQQTETYSWMPIKISNQNNFRPGAFVLKVDAGAVYAPVMSQKVVVRDGAGHTTSNSSFDSYGNPAEVAETGPGGGNRNTSISYFVSTEKWLLHQRQNESSAGVQIQRSFDPSGNLISETRNGISTRYTYDAQGNVASVTLPGNKTHTYRSYVRGIAQSESQPEGIQLTRTVDGLGNVTQQTDGNGQSTGYSYDALSRLTAIRYPMGNPVSITYDATSKTATRGALTQVTRHDGFGRTIGVESGGISHTYRVDSLGRMVFASNPGSGSGSSYQYDALDRVIGVTHADGARIGLAFGPGRHTITDERNNSWSREYRSYGDPEYRVLMALTPPDTGSALRLTRNTRDQVLSITQAGLTRSYGYNGAGYLISATHPETGITQFGRDEAGNMISRSVGSSGVTSYVYDGQNRLASVSYPGGTPAITHTYDRANQRVSSVSSVARRTYSYDSNRNLRSETLAVDGFNWTAAYAYDGNDQLSALTYPKTASQVNYAPNPLGRPTQVSGYASQVAFWPSGQLQQIAYLNGSRTSFGQNSRLFPSTMKVVGVLNGAGIDSSYVYDGVGNLTTISDGVDAIFNRASTYDAMNRLITSSGPWGAGGISYDATGNLRQANWGSLSRTYGYDGSNRLTTLAMGSQSQTFRYDVYGNVSSVSDSSFLWDDSPNLKCVQCNHSSRIDYAYDPDRHRVLVTHEGGKTYEFHDSQDRLLMSYSPTTQATTEYIYLGRQRIAQKVSY